jgi:hypothetical protein
MHPIVMDIERLAETVSVEGPDPDTGPRTVIKLCVSSGIGPNVAACGGLLHAQQTSSSVHAAAAHHGRRAFSFICLGYQRSGVWSMTWPFIRRRSLPVPVG